jgi:hypothetical protein
MRRADKKNREDDHPLDAAHAQPIGEIRHKKAGTCPAQVIAKKALGG